ncbi:hypothetical protein [Embleya sp. NPDC020886]|uniref:nSTAND1 domain-containing NTPase n=1 Tax=Embleya sp. NPDC020886 TaxID=3363980 RepID=UPI0037B00EBD
MAAFGFPGQAPPGGHFAYMQAGNLLPRMDRTDTLLQLADANGLTQGFSGGPVVDEVTGLVLGMATAITAPDGHQRGLGTAYATPAEVLRGVWPGLSALEVCPYRGLEPFTDQDARWFHGRDAVVERVLSVPADRRRVLLLGPSGSGKSSLVQAGVLPALAAGRVPGAENWLPVYARPGRDLLAELEHAGLPGATTEGIVAAARTRLTGSPGQRVLLVVDQFEEVLTADAHGGPERARDALAELADAVRDASHLIRVVLVLRDDFQARLAARAPALTEAIEPATYRRPWPILCGNGWTVEPVVGVHVAVATA